MRSMRLGAALLLTGCLTACMMQGLAPYGAQVLSEKAVAESLEVLSMLEQRIRSQPRDPEAWHRRGMIAWALRERDRQKPPIKSLDWTMLGRMADTSLRIAAQLRKQSASYKRDVKAFLLASGAVWTPLVTQNMVNTMERSALEDVRNAATPRERADGIIRVARTYWRVYETKRGGIRKTGGEWPVTGIVDSDAVRVVGGMISRASQPDARDTSDADYRRAEPLFREAYAAAPDYDLTFQQLAMVLVAKNRWTELAALATHHLLDANFDPAAWLALGLASQRLGDGGKATTAFTYALQNMSSEARARLDNVQRVLRPSDTLQFALTRSAERARLERAYWLRTEPLWSRQTLQARNEFLARLALAEFRWSLPELSMHGADTDRGRMYVRFGPPELIAGPDFVWVYDAGPVIVFDGAKGLGTASLEQPSKAERVIETIPSLWTNVSSIRVQEMQPVATRFRAGDSVDVFVAGTLTGRVQRNAAGGTAYLWMLTHDTLVRVRDSARVTDSASMQFRRRVATGTYDIRSEVVAASAPVASRGMTSVIADADPRTGFEMRGFGLSDILIAAHVSPRGARQARWTDFDIVPLDGSVAPGGTIDLLWEIYEAGAREGSATYDVALTIARPDMRSGVGRIAAQVIGSVAGIDREENRIVSRFTRTLPASRALADHISVGFGDTSPGTYAVTLDVTDRTTGKVTSRTTSIVVR